MVVEGVVVGRNNCSLIKDGADRKQTEQDGSPTVHNQSHGAQPKHGNEPTTVKANQQVWES